MNNQNTHKQKNKDNANSKNKKPFIASDDYFEYGEYLDLSSKEINKNVIDSFFKSHSLKSKKINPTRNKTR